MADEKETSKGGLNVKLIAIIGVVVVIFAGLLAFGTAKFVMSSLTPGGGKTPVTSQVKKTEVGTLFDAGEFVTNIYSDAGSRFIKINITLDLSEKKTADEMTEKLAKVRDTIIKILRNKTVEQMRDPKHDEQLKKEIKDKVNEFTATGKVENVYFTYFVIQ